MSSIAFAKECNLAELYGYVEIKNTDPSTPILLVTSACEEDKSTFTLSCTGYTLNTCKISQNQDHHNSSKITDPVFVGCTGMVATITVSDTNPTTCTVTGGHVWLHLHGGVDGGPDITMSFTNSN